MLNQGKNEQGNRKLIESVDITPEIAYRLIEVLKKRGIQFIVAPYEADAELAYLSRSGIADVIITEDSDLLAYGAKKILYKYDANTLTGE